MNNSETRHRASLLSMGLLWLMFFPGQAQTMNIQGKVIDRRNDAPVPFANIAVKHQPFGTGTNEEGRFALHLDSTYRDDTLVVSALGFRNSECPVSKLDRSNPVVIVLRDTSYLLNEV